MKKSSKNVDVLLNARVTKVLIENNQAYGVQYIVGNDTNTVRASKEVSNPGIT